MLGLAYRELPAPHGDADLTRDLTFVGLVGMIDPLRDETKATIATCTEAGIRTVMITGDQQTTAAEIARQLGLDRDPQGKLLRTVHARDLAGLDDAGWLEVIKGASVFARVSPEPKLKIVDALQREGQVVAMTGDGVTGCGVEVVKLASRRRAGSVENALGERWDGRSGRLAAARGSRVRLLNNGVVFFSALLEENSWVERARSGPRPRAHISQKRSG